MSVPSVDVIIAARDEAGMIGACLESLRVQEYGGRIGVCVVDNGSTDATADLAAARGAQVVREARPGRGVARNAGLRATEAELVAFVDAHVVVAPDWVRHMAGGLDEPCVGGCQSRIENRATSARVQRYLDASLALSNEQVLAGSVRAERNLYPWVATGHCMYRRAALKNAGGFDERLVACEDVELAWRVVARGYRLRYVPEAAAVHIDASPWPRFVAKSFGYGRGAAQLEARYRQHGARTTFAAVRVRKRHSEDVLATLAYRAGFGLQRWVFRLGADRRQPPVPPGNADERLRPWFEWNAPTRLRIAPAALYWLHDEQACSIVVRPIDATRRHALEGTADLVWRGLTGARTRDQVSRAISERYDVDPATAARDVDALLDELIAAGLVERTRGSERA